MTSYLEEYERNSWGFGKLAKAVGWVLLASVLGYCLYWLFFRNWREEFRVKEFLSLLEAQQYEQAYETWGCSQSEPCKYYSYKSFLEDWGPESPFGPVKSFELGRSYTQDGGVILEVTVNGRKQPNLWVESSALVIGFFPY
jgi:hypothetical protein